MRFAPFEQIEIIHRDRKERPMARLFIDQGNQGNVVLPPVGAAIKVKQDSGFVERVNLDYDQGIITIFLYD